MMPASRRLQCQPALLALLLIAASFAPASAQEISVSNTAPADGTTRLLRQPTLSASHVAFAYGNDLWVAGRTGGAARRLTSFPGEETHPHFSPDGRTIAFSAQYGGNTDVYVLPVDGGEPVRLTWHPGPDIVQGWTPDGTRIVFSSGRTNAPTGQKFWTVNLTGDFPQPLPMPRAHQGQFSPDGRRFAYRMVSPWEDEWRNYRGGQNRPVWILDMSTHDVEEVTPWDGSNDGDPVWIAETVYFLSDRDYATNIWAYDTRTKQLRQVTTYSDLDVKTLGTDGRTLVYEQAGYLHTLDPAAGTPQRLDITVRGDFPWLMPQWKEVPPNALRNAAISPTGKRAVFEARGEIISVPLEKGDWRNLTRTSGVAERSPAWSPDGRWISWFSDEGGEYSLVISEQDGLAEPRVIDLPSPSFQFTPAWSPDSRSIMFTDTHLRLWVVDVESGRATHADTDTYMAPERSMNPVWSPDSRWIAYAKRLPSQFHAIHVYDTRENRTHQLTDGLSDATWPAWDAGGKYLYFLASTNWALNTGWLDMSSYERPVTRAVYLAVLPADEPSPLLPESDEEPAASGDRSTDADPDSGAAAGAAGGARGERSGAAGTRAPAVRIDFDGLMQRVISLDVPARDYSQLRAGAAGTVFYLEASPGAGGSSTLHRYIMKDREAKPFTTGVSQYAVSTDGRKMLFRAGQNWSIVDTDKAAPTGTTGRLSLADVRVNVDPRQEFRQMFDEGWRFQRDFLYVPNMHGADYVETKAMYEPLVAHVAHRSDLTYLLDWMGGEVSIGHSFVRGGDAPDVPDVDVGLLGADYEIRNGRYRIAKVYSGENWNPGLRAPLSGPGIDVNEGDYILEVNGVDVRAPESIYRHFENTANQQTAIRVGPNANGSGSRLVTVVPVSSEGQLRQREWIEENRRKVDEMSGGRLAYVWVPNTGQGGYTYFNRYYFAQQDRQGAIIDERFNSGGSAADYMVDIMNRRLHGYFNNAVGERVPFTSPGAGIWGPKVMIINEMAGSGGDLLPYMFRFNDVGPIVGTRTWGGLVGTWDTPPLIDGGTMIAPRGGFFDIDGNWAVENEGVAPDIHVEMTPKDVIAGRDPQLERAVQEALRLLRENPVELKAEPAPPVRSRRPGGGIR